jgi:lipoprotein-anchoring transpeptidase ErfK/SrfK
VIVNHERNLYFVEEPGQAIRYPVAIGKPVDPWQGVQTIYAARITANCTAPARNRNGGQKQESTRWASRASYGLALVPS